MPYTGIVLALVAVHLALFLILLGHWVAAAGMWPKAARAFADVYEQRPVRALLVGVFTYGPLIVLLLTSGNVPNPLYKIVALIGGFGAILFGFIGTSGLALRIGRNLSPSADIWQQALRGGVMLALVFITPFLGWLFLLHVGLASGFGAFLLARPWKSKSAEPFAVPATAAPVEMPVAATASLS
ncbi:hypothetical protein [Flavobacterium sp.]|uniref:hypothetical protein n=1 Tax=Flavobacterium sp. TaxID=239 RepID=UPI00375030B0